VNGKGGKGRFRALPEFAIFGFVGMSIGEDEEGYGDLGGLGVHGGGIVVMAE